MYSLKEKRMIMIEDEKKMKRKLIEIKDIITILALT